MEAQKREMGEFKVEIKNALIKAKSFLNADPGALKRLVIIVLLSGFGVAIWQLGSSRNNLEGHNARPSPIDTQIPAGWVLYPISVQNLEALDSIFGSHGIVDLFTAPESGRSVTVAKKVKLLRAPLNPSVFAVLIPESRVSEITAHNGPFLVVVQSRSTTPAMKGGAQSAPRKGPRFTIVEETL